MATTPANGAQQGAPRQLPLFYKALVPLSSQQHANLGIEERSSLEFTRGTHAVPITVDEFVSVQRHYPIVFSTGAGGAPLALLGLREGENHFLDDDGKWRTGAYVPAYIRRYPFLLAKLRPDTDELSLCVDDSCPEIGEDKDRKFFDGTTPSEVTRNILSFCEQFEQSIARTRQFVQELEKLDLLMEGEVTIQAPNAEQPAVYRGFRMINEEKLKELRGDQVRKLVQNGILPLVYAHLISVQLIRDLHARANPLPAFPDLGAAAPPTLNA